MKMEEIWKDIEGYEGKYKISNYGKVKSLKNNIILKETISNSKYLYVTLYNLNGKQKKHTIHRLVAQAFIPNSNEYLVVNHIDGNKTNNKMDNLEWCTYSHNTLEAHRLGLQKSWCGTKFGKQHPNYKFRGKWKTQKPVLQFDLKNNFIKEYNSATEIERELKLSCSHISECCRGIRKTCGGYIWKRQEQ